MRSGSLRENNPGVEVSLLDYRLKGEGTLDDDLRSADVVAAGASTADFSDAIRILRRAKELGKRTIMGGILPTLISDEVLMTGVVDYVIKGEGERPLSELLTAHLDARNIAGVSFVRDGVIVHNPQGTALQPHEIPRPDYDLVDLREYHGKSTGPMYSARGCPVGCSFCTLNTFWRYSYRAEPVERVLENIAKLESLGFTDIRFKDEDFPLNKRRTMELLSEMKQAGFKADFKAKTRVDRVTPELLGAMQDAGITMLYSGLETLNLEEARGVNKGYKGDFGEQLKLLLNSGMRLEFGFILGLQGTTRESLERSVAAITELGQHPRVIPRVTFLTPYPGTELWRNPTGLRMVTTDWDRYNSVHPVCVPESLGVDAVDLLVNAYDRIRHGTQTEHFNPTVEEGYVESARRVLREPMRAGKLVRIEV